MAIKDNGIYLDCTFGRGGHSQAILKKLGETGRLLALDRDVMAVNSDTAKELLKDRRFKLRHSSFSALESLLAEDNLTGNIDGILLDLGVSSPQLDDPKRGFSFMQDGPLDMRMDSTAELTAAKWLAQVDEKELARVLFEYGEERFARRIARAIVEARAEQPLTTTRELTKLIETAIPKRELHKHPATAASKRLGLK